MGYDYSSIGEKRRRRLLAEKFEAVKRAVNVSILQHAAALECDGRLQIDDKAKDNSDENALDEDGSGEDDSEEINSNKNETGEKDNDSSAEIEDGKGPKNGRMKQKKKPEVRMFQGQGTCS